MTTENELKRTAQLAAYSPTYKIMSPMARPENNIVSYYSPADGIKDGLLIDPAYHAEYYSRHIICKPYRVILTRQTFNLIEKAADSPTGHSDRQGIYTDLLTMYSLAAKRVQPDEATAYFKTKINGRLYDFKAVLQPLDASPDPDGYMIDETPLIVISLID